MAKFCCTFTFLLFTGTLCAQELELYFYSAGGEEFHLGIDGYRQGKEAASAHYIKGLDTGEHRIHIQMVLPDSVEFSKSIDLPDSGLHYYTLTRDSRKNPVLHYRGMWREKDRDITGRDFEKGSAWEKWDKSHRLTVKHPKEEEPTPEAKDSAVLLAAEKTGNKLDEGSIDSSNSNSQQEIQGELSKEEFEIELGRIRDLPYEYEKLQRASQLAMSADLDRRQLEDLIRSLSYEQSRLDFIDNIAGKYSDKYDLLEFASLLQYEVSRRRLQKKIKDLKGE